jgi:hypothetical protein
LIDIFIAYSFNIGYCLLFEFIIDLFVICRQVALSTAEMKPDEKK